MLIDSSSATTSRRPIRQYDHADFYPTIRPTDVFLCTYPKSGTTWLGFLIAQLLRAEGEEALNLKSFEEYVPDVNLRYTKRGSLSDFGSLGDPRFFRCHAAYDENLPRVIYVLRDPRDVMLSYWHFEKLMKKDFTLPLGEYLERNDHWPCEWDDHVASWLCPRRHPNLLVVKYEEMHEDTTRVLREVLEFSGLEYSDERIARAVEDSRFEKMREAEEKFGVQGKAGDENERFVRKGKRGSWRDEMNAEDVRILEEKYGETMRQVGYT
jgi:Sulfotransferase domain